MPVVHPKAETVRLASWEEADAALLEIGRLDERRAALKAGLCAFAERRRSDFGEDSSRRLLHGRLGWRNRTRRTVKDLEETARLLRDSEFAAAVVPAIDYDLLKDLSRARLAAFGIQEKTAEEFFVEPARALP
jgi:hypothetical protein